MNVAHASSSLACKRATIDYVLALKDNHPTLHLGNAAQNMAMLCQIALNLVHQEPGKGSVRIKRTRGRLEQRLFADRVRL